MKTKEYTNGEITIVWKSEVCILSAKCAMGLRQVFKPRDKPWIQMENSTSDKIVQVVNKCPSGAISIKE